MYGVNLIAVFNASADRVLMCKRKKAPYKGLYNFVGGHIEQGEESLSASYRELFEETGITRDDIELIHLMDTTYHMDSCLLEVYVGRLNKEFDPKGDENELVWMTLDQNFFSMEKFAGEGNIGHIMEHVKYWNLVSFTHHMNLRPEPFEKIRSGKKNIELRLYDEKRRKIAVGDKIVFEDTENAGNTITAEVLKLHRAPSFFELMKMVPPEKCGFDENASPHDCSKAMREYYSENEENENGVLGIEIKVI